MSAPAIDSKIDAKTLAPVFAREGRLHVSDFFTADSAQRLAVGLADRSWQSAVYDGATHRDLDSASLDALAPAEKDKLRTAIYAGAAHGFRYWYDNYPVADLVAAGKRRGDAAEDVFDFLNSAAFLDFVRTLTGDQRPTFCDAQVTRYRPGHFLTAHDDDVSGKNRLYAYVLNFTPNWRADWGGLLLFLDKDGHVREGYTPAFNALNIFRVPQPHAVSLVAPFAQGARLSVTGWIRAKG